MGPTHIKPPPPPLLSEPSGTSLHLKKIINKWTFYIIKTRVTLILIENCWHTMTQTKDLTQKYSEMLSAMTSYSCSICACFL